MHPVGVEPTVLCMSSRYVHRYTKDADTPNRIRTYSNTFVECGALRYTIGV